MLHKRLIALALVLVCLLAGCAKKTENATVRSEKSKQAELSRKEALELTQQAEYALLAASFTMQQQEQVVSGYLEGNCPAYMGDIDQDGDLEFVCTDVAYTFDLSDGYNATINWEQGGNSYCTDADGNFYLFSGMGDGYGEGSNWYEFYSDWYSVWDGSQWVETMTCSQEDIYSYYDNVVADAPYSTEFTAEIDGESVSEDEWVDHMNQLSIEECDSNTRTLSTFSMDAKHCDSIVDELKDYFEDNYEISKASLDADDDGEKELFIAVHNPLHRWIDALIENSDFAIETDWMGYDFTSDYTVILVVDPTEDDVVISAHCIKDIVNVDKQNIIYNDGYLVVSDQIVTLPRSYKTISALDSDEKDEVYQYLLTFLDHAGYECYGFKYTDLSTTGNQEILAVCADSEGWHSLLFTLQNGHLTAIWKANLEDSAIYLVDWNGKQHLMDYYQWVNNVSGTLYTRYSYSLFRFDGDYVYDEIDYQTISYSNSDKDATAVSNFFKQFNQYFDSATIIGDPYSITGNQWASDNDMDYGTMPENNTAAQNEKLGYVQIEDPASFLFLREGPGKEYDPVLIDPNNKNSYVKQAQGSPVTILEEVYTGDSENPVWVKIRIHYGDREIIGYSSKTYIREAY